MIDYSLYLCTDCEMNKKYEIEECVKYEIEECVKQAIQGGVTFVQVRVKDKSFNDFLDIAQRIKSVTDYYNIPLIINDNIDIALKINADGIHIGQNDLPCIQARKILSNDKIVGVSVTSLEEATYLGVGAIYKSHTKKDAKIVGEDELKKIAEFSNIPVIVIGGINEYTIPKLKGIKIDGYAMIRPIIGQDDIISSTKKLKKIIYTNKYK